MSSALDKVMSVVKAVAPVAANTVIPGSGSLVSSIIKKVAGVSDETPIDTAAEMVVSNPALMVELERIAAEREIELARSDASVLTAVNKTMVAEAGQHPWSGMWRPFWGFASAVSFFLCIIGIIALCFYAVGKNCIEFFGVLPTLVAMIATLFGVPGAILGVASWHRGVEKRVQAGEQPKEKKGFADVVKAFKGVS